MAVNMFKRCYGKLCRGEKSSAAAAVQDGNPPPLQDPSFQDGPYANVDLTLRGLAGAAEGFGNAAIGGVQGPVYHVNTLEEGGPGSLRDGCRQNGPLWIVFDVSGTIVLSSPVRVSSFKTIDGRGQRVKVSGNGFQLNKCKHVIICNLILEGGRGHDVDGIQIKPDTENVWIDRCSLSDYDDGLIDITRKSTKITVSRCHFHDHNKTMLISADASHIEDRNMLITIHHCFFDGTKQRHPRVRYGKVHLYNNYTRNWGIYAVCASIESQIYSQCNVYEAGPKKKKAFEYYTEQAPDKELPSTGSLCSEGDVLLNGAQGEPVNPDCVFRPNEFYESFWTVMPAGKALMEKIPVMAGWQNVPLPPLC